MYKRQIEQAAPAHSERLRVLIAPMISKEDAPKFKPFHQLDALAGWLESAGVEVKLLAYGVELQEFKQLLVTFQPHVLQWLGHGRPDQAVYTPPVANAEIEGEQRNLDSPELALTIDAAMPRVVLLENCELGLTAQQYGVPRALLSLGAGAVIAFHDRVSALETFVFARGFYLSLLLGQGVHEAVQAGRKELRALEAVVKIAGAFANPMLVYGDRDALRPLCPPRSLATADVSETGRRPSTPVAGESAETSPPGSIPEPLAGQSASVPPPYGTEHPLSLPPIGPDHPLSLPPVGPDHSQPIPPVGPDLPLSLPPVGPDHSQSIPLVGPEQPLSLPPVGPDHSW